MGVLQRDPIPKLCFAMVLTICKDFCHDLTDRSCSRLTPLVCMMLNTFTERGIMKSGV